MYNILIFSKYQNKILKHQNCPFYSRFTILLFSKRIFANFILIVACCYTGKAIQKSDGSTT